jgi:hypothetical protein
LFVTNQIEQPFVLQGALAEVDQQGQVGIGYFEVGDGLGLM